MPGTQCGNPITCFAFRFFANTRAIKSHVRELASGRRAKRGLQTTLPTPHLLINYEHAPLTRAPALRPTGHRQIRGNAGNYHAPQKINLSYFVFKPKNQQHFCPAATLSGRAGLLPAPLFIAICNRYTPAPYGYQKATTRHERTYHSEVSLHHASCPVSSKLNPGISGLRAPSDR